MALQSIKNMGRTPYYKAIELRDQLLKTSRVTLERPIFIWGTGRSGTHLLFDVLSLHPALIFPRAKTRWKKGLWGNMHWGENTPEQLKGRPIPEEGFQRFWMDAGLQFDFKGLLRRQDLDNRIASAIRERYASTLYREWFWNGSLTLRILDKTPIFVMMLDAVDAIFPDAYHIYCLRDPRAVLNSFLRNARFPEKESSTAGIPETGFWSSLRPPGYEAYQSKPLAERLAWQVQTLVEIGFASREFLGDRLICFKYEELLSDSHTSADWLLQRLDLAPFPGIRALIPPKFSDYSPPWPDADGRVAESYGRIRCYRDDEIGQVTGLNDLAVQMGYDRYRVGVVTETSLVT